MRLVERNFKGLWREANCHSLMAQSHQLENQTIHHVCLMIPHPINRR